MITIIGNGESRKEINIDKIQGLKVGCNGIYLHNSVDYICAMDKFWRDKIVKECSIPLISRIHNTAFQKTLELYDKSWQNTKCYYRGYCSGITALDYICTYFKDDIYMIGFDFDYEGEKVNHIYKDTPNHPKSDRPAQNENIFLNQFIETYKRYPRHKIVWVTNSKKQIKIGIKELPKMSINKYKKLGAYILN